MDLGAGHGRDQLVVRETIYVAAGWEAPECRAVLRLSNGRTMRGRDSAESALIDAVTPAGIGDTGLPVNITAALNPAGLGRVAPVASADQVAELAPVGAAAGPALEGQSS